MELKKSVVKSVVSKDMFNDLHKFEVSLEDGTNGMMYKKSENPFIKIGDDVVFTLNSKGTIKIIPKGQENTSFTPSQPTPSKDSLIMIQTMFKCSAEYHAHRQGSSEDDVAETAQVWHEIAMRIGNEKATEPTPVVIEKTKVVEVANDNSPF